MIPPAGWIGYRIIFWLLIAVSVWTVTKILPSLSLRRFQVVRATAFFFWAYCLEFLMVAALDASHHLWRGMFTRLAWALLVFRIGDFLTSSVYNGFISGQIIPFVTGNGDKVFPRWLYLRFVFCKSPYVLQQNVLSELRQELKRKYPGQLRERRKSDQAEIKMSLEAKSTRRQIKLANYQPRPKERAPTAEKESRLGIIATVRHIFLRDIENRRLQIDELLPTNADKAMAKEILLSLLVLGRRKAINQSAYYPFGFVHHRVEKRYQRRSGEPFDFAVFRQTLGQLESEGIIITKAKAGKSEKIMLSLRSVPGEAKTTNASMIVQQLNHLKQDALAGRLT